MKKGKIEIGDVAPPIPSFVFFNANPEDTELIEKEKENEKSSAQPSRRRKTGIKSKSPKQQ